MKNEPPHDIKWRWLLLGLALLIATAPARWISRR